MRKIYDENTRKSEQTEAEENIIGQEINPTKGHLTYDSIDGEDRKNQ